jgi:thiol-disulfide isomerase/thioredoxin
MPRPFLAATLASTLLLAPGALGAPPTDEAVRAVTEDFSARRNALLEGGHAKLEDIRTLYENPLGDLDIAEMTPSQIAMARAVRALDGLPTEPTYELRDRAAERLHAFRDDRSVQGAVARILLLQIEGGATRFGKPEYELQTELLKQTLAHPKLDDAVREHDVALISSISSLARIRAWQDSREQILALQRFFDDRMPPRMANEISDYWSMLEHILDAESDEDQALRQHIRATLVERGRAAISAGTFSEREREFLEMTVNRLDGAAARGELLGGPAPAIDFAWTSDESLTSLEALKGSVVMLDFWATWCGPCIASIPNVRELQARYEGYPFKIIGITSVQGMHVPPEGDPIDTKGDPEREYALMPGYIDERGITWTIAFSEQNVFNPDYGVRGIPHVVLIDANGIVRYNDLHPADPLAEKAAKIDALLREAGLPVPPPIEPDEEGGG